MTSNVLRVTVRNVYGENKIYPVCAKAKALAAIAGTKTLTNDTMTIASTELGYEFCVVPELVLVGVKLEGADNG